MSISPVELQHRLNQLGESLRSGVLDAATRAAICRFQQRGRLKPTGELDVATTKALKNSTTWQAPVIKVERASPKPSAILQPAVVALPPQKKKDEEALCLTPRKTCIVQLGRHGDLINILPIAWAIFQRTHIRPVVLVSAEFAGTLDGVSYVNVEVWDGPYYELLLALRWAKQHFEQVLATQVCAYDYMITPKCLSFVEDSWAEAGFLAEWGKLPLVFDRRELHTELALFEQHATKLPMLLLSLASHSSPYLLADQLNAEVVSRWGDTFNIVNVSEFRCNHIYDLLGLFDRAALLVTIDTATLHLAAASKVPVVELITDQPTWWNGTKSRCNVVLSLRYGESATRMEEVHRAIAMARPRRLLHVYSGFKATERRHAFAAATWVAQYGQGAWLSVPMADNKFPRIFDDRVRQLPYIRDLVDHAMLEVKSSWDVIVLTNSDTCLADDATAKLLRRLNSMEACYSYRRDFSRLDHPLSGAEVAFGVEYDGCDLFAFTAGWWLAHQREYPDMLLGAEAWDWVLRVLIERSHHSCQSCSFNDLIYHEWHVSTWDFPGVGDTLPSRAHNRALASKFFKVPSKVAKCIPDEDRILSFYRRHEIRALHRKKGKLPEDLHQRILSNNPKGIGDCMLLTPLPKLAFQQKKSHVFIHSESPHFQPIIQFNPYYRPPDLMNFTTISADLIQNVCEMGNGHFMQRLQRAYGLTPDIRPMGFLSLPRDVVPGRVALHFDPGVHVKWQRQHVHTRARELYPQSRKIIQHYVKSRWDLEFYQVGRNPIKFDGVQDKTSLSLEETILFLNTCEWFIGIISGPMHLATALGVRCIVIVNFPHAARIYLPTLLDIDQVESEWFYPQNVHLHQDSEGELVKLLSFRNLEIAMSGGLYPYWSDRYLPLVHEKL